MGFADMTKEDLWKLRKEICLNSLFVSDYRNNFGFTEESVCTFFDGYMEFLGEIAEERFGEKATLDNVFTLDDAENLYEWFCCFEEFPFEMEEVNGTGCQ